MQKKRALIAMSGGVDSSVAAYLMKKEGLDCIGATMKLYESDQAGFIRSHTCCSLDDVEDARSVAERLDMPYYVFNFMDGFEQKIIDKFIRSYEAGWTPNPCIDCNRYMKFDQLYERARLLSCDYVVTGHYARIEQEGGRYLLKKARDASKDQSYVLYAMSQEDLAHTRFPLGNLEKTQTRKLAEEAGFINAEKPDSQDICFVPDGDYARVIEERTGRAYLPGDFLSIDGKKLGRHQGIIHYTLGQRRGLGIASDRPLYVQEIRPLDNTVILGHEEDLYSQKVEVADFHWISGTSPREMRKLRAKLRYRQKEEPCQVKVEEDGHVWLIFDEPQRAVTKGQAAVVYDGDVVLGGGTIVGQA